MHIGAIWRIRLNRPRAAPMRPYVKLLRPLVIIYRYFLFSEIRISYWTPIHFSRENLIIPIPETKICRTNQITNLI